MAVEVYADGTANKEVAEYVNAYYGLDYDCKRNGSEHHLNNILECLKCWPISLLRPNVVHGGRRIHKMPIGARSTTKTLEEALQSVRSCAGFLFLTVRKWLLDEFRL